MPRPSFWRACRQASSPAGNERLTGARVKVLLLRAEPAAGRTGHALERLGHQAVLAPLFEIAAVADGRVPAAPTPRPYASVVAASANAFAMLAEESRASLAGLPAMVVGARSAQWARSLSVALPWPAYRSARELAAALEKEAPPEPVLYLAGRDRRPEIEAALRRRGSEFRLVEIYGAQRVKSLPGAARAALRRGEIGAVLHYSARSASAYLELAGGQDLLRQALAPAQLCLSVAVARPLSAAGAQRVRIAAAPEEAELLKLLPASTRR